MYIYRELSINTWCIFLLFVVVFVFAFLLFVARFFCALFTLFLPCVKFVCVFSFLRRVYIFLFRVSSVYCTAVPGILFTLAVLGTNAFCRVGSFFGVFRCGMNLVVLQRNDALKAFFPFHDEERRARLYAMWVNKFAAPSAQPLDEVKVGQMSVPKTIKK